MLNKKNIILLFFIFLSFLLSLLVFQLYKERLTIQKEPETRLDTPRSETTPRTDSLSESADTGFYNDFNKIVFSDGGRKSTLDTEEFCLDNFEVENRWVEFVGYLGNEVKKSNEITDFLSEGFAKKIALYEDLDCREEDSDICRKIDSINELNALINGDNDDYCENYNNEPDKDKICNLLKETARNKGIYLPREIKPFVCSVDEGVAGATIYYSDEINPNQQCLSDGGGVLNIILATANKDPFFCEGIKDERLGIHKTSCYLGSINGNSEISLKNYKESVCKVFSDGVNK